jgi:hypothetical protein
MDWLDQYEIRGRMAPAIIISLPLAISIITIVSIISDKLTQLLLGYGIIVLVLVYALSFLVRHFGRKIEKGLWSNWGGAPSIRLMRWKDPTFGGDLKEQLHKAVENDCGIRLSSPEEEYVNPQKADEQIMQAFLQVKAIVRKNDPDGIWTKHNAEYGFHRNLLGSKWIWLIFSIIGVVASGITLYFKKDDTLILGLALNIFLIIISILSGWYFLPMMIKDSAERYAESIWNSFLVCSKGKSK